MQPQNATFLQLLKETGPRPGEAWQLEWIDFDFENKTVNITPEKNNNPRKLKVSDKLILMLKSHQTTRIRSFRGLIGTSQEDTDDNPKESQSS